MPKRIDINTATKRQLEKFVRYNSVFVNQSLKELENADKESSNAYRYIQDKTDKINKYFKVEDGTKRFNTTTKKSVEKLSINELRQVGKVLQDYKEAKTSTVAKYNKVIEESYSNFKDSYKEQTNQDISKDDFEKLVKSKNWNESKEKFSSGQLMNLVGTFGLEVALQSLDSDVSTVLGLYNEAERIQGTFLD